MDWSGWRRHFERNARRALPAVEIPEGLPARLTRSLAKFQLGETGEGRIVGEIRRSTMAGIDDDYKESLALFVKEEGRHARILAGIVKGMGGTLLGREWTERLFTHGRRMMGMRTKLMTLLAAEVVGIGFYGLTARSLPPGSLRATLEQIAGDEAAHLAFHCDFFRTQARTRVGRGVFLAGWWTLGGTACALVLLEHGPTLAELGVPRRETARRYWHLLRGVARDVTSEGANAQSRMQSVTSRVPVPRRSAMPTVRLIPTNHRASGPKPIAVASASVGGSRRSECSSFTSNGGSIPITD